MRRRKEDCSEIVERRMRARLEKSLNQMCKEGLILNAQVNVVDCSSPGHSMARGMIEADCCEDMKEAMYRLFEGEANARQPGHH